MLCILYIYVYVLHGSALSIAITTHLHFHGVQKAVRLVPWHQHQVMVMLNMVLAIIMDVYAEAVCKINHQGLSPMFHPTYQGKTEWYVNGMLKKSNEINEAIMRFHGDMQGIFMVKMVGKWFFS